MKIKLNKTTYTLLGIFLVVAGLFIYHFVAANQAEKDIKDSIEKLSSDNRFFFSLSTSGVNIKPFAGDIILENLNAINQNYSFNLGSVKLDLTYLDFLNIYFNGPEYGLKKAESGLIETRSFSMVWRPLFLQVKLDTLLITHTGKVAELLPESRNKPLAGTKSTELIVEGVNLKVSQPNSQFGTIIADSVYFRKFVKTRTDTGRSFMDSLSLRNIVWTPPSNLKEKYDFFIRGFGYQRGEIPIETIVLAFTQSDQANHFSIKPLRVRNDLITANANGQILIDYSDLSSSQLENMEIRITEISEKLDNLLANFEQLFKLQLPRKGEEIQLFLNGSLGNPLVVRPKD